MTDSANDNPQPQYEIGYRKPPSHTQFKPGMSGNANGRPKGARNFATVIEQELKARIEVTENGKRKRISKREAIAKQTVNRAAGGDHKATTTLLNEARFQEMQNQSPVGPVLTVRAADQMVMDSIVQRIRQSQSLFVDGGSVPKLSGENELADLTETNGPATPNERNQGGI